MQALDASGLLRLSFGARRLVRAPWLTVLTYHRVADPAVSPGFDPEVIDATPDQFERCLEVVKRHFTPVRIREVVDCIAGRGRLPPNPALITFDDGYRDCHDEALPRLRRHGVPATFFIATRYLTERRMFWWDRLVLLLQRARRPRFTLEYPLPLHVDAGDAKAARMLLDLVKTTFDLDLERFLDGIARAGEAELPADEERALADRQLMTWEQVRALADAGMDVESHTRTHRVLETLPADRLDDELAGSRADLEERVGRPVTAIAYPVGYRIKSPEVRAALARAGYAIGFTNASGVTYLLGRPDPFDLCRLAPDRRFSDTFFRGILAFPQLAWTR